MYRIHGRGTVNGDDKQKSRIANLPFSHCLVFPCSTHAHIHAVQLCGRKWEKTEIHLNGTTSSSWRVWVVILCVRSGPAKSDPMRYKSLKSDHKDQRYLGWSDKQKKKATNDDYNIAFLPGQKRNKKSHEWRLQYCVFARGKNAIITWSMGQENFVVGTSVIQFIASTFKHSLNAFCPLLQSRIHSEEWNWVLFKIDFSADRL